MKVCFIGVRGHTGYVLDSLAEMPRVAVTGVCAGCDDDVSPLVEACQTLGQAPQIFADWRRMLDRAEPDVLVVAGPFEKHAEICAEAFGRGLHVFCEKPVAMTLKELAMLRAAHAASGVHFAAMMGMRYDPAFYAAHVAVVAGAVGQIRLINTRKSYKLGQRAEFYRHRDTYGGTIPWVGSHAIDWIHWFAGRPFESVYATHSTAHNRDHGELETSALCQFTLADDIVASASIDYYRPDGAPSHGDDRIRVAGTDGVIEVVDGQITLIGADGAEILRPHRDRWIFEDFVNQVEGRGPALIGPADTVAVAEACLLARQSADEGRVISFDREGGS